MLSPVNEPGESTGPISVAESLARIGLLLTVAGLGGAVITLVVASNPPPLVIATCLVGALVGVGLRIEGAIRERR